ncbi:MAG TPA: DUF1016 N-terminal domain-containing protein, partial [Fimbriiglobus sp.]|nr:DUF1016 N-terminal domain-containing protein [Fimbriiglobus sp.]
EIVALIDAARARAIAAVNHELVDLYWQVGEYISRKVETAAWGDGVIDQLATHIARTHPALQGFNRRNLFRMRQFYETYRGDGRPGPGPRLPGQVRPGVRGLRVGLPVADRRAGGAPPAGPAGPEC